MPSIQDFWVAVVGNSIIACALFLYFTIDSDVVPEYDPPSRSQSYEVDLQPVPVEIDLSLGDCVLGKDCRFLPRDWTSP